MEVKEQDEIFEYKQSNGISWNVKWDRSDMFYYLSLYKMIISTICEVNVQKFFLFVFYNEDKTSESMIVI